MSGHWIRSALATALSLLGAFPALAQSAPSAFTYATRYDAEHRVTGTIAPDPDEGDPLHHAAVRNSYDAAGRLIRVEKGELAAWQPEAVAPASWSGFTVFQSVETTYDALDRKLTETQLSAGAAYTLTQYGYDAVGRLECTAVRMNPAAFGSLPASACTLGAAGAQGPDRITQQVYDAAGQVLKVRKAVGTALAQDYATYSYSPTGKQTSMTDANGNRAEMSYDGFDRQRRWTFPSRTTPGSADPGDYEQYDYDAAGNRTVLQKRDGRAIGYTYDALNRVTRKSFPLGGATDVYYGYDLQGLQLYARFGGAAGVGITNTYDQFGRLRTSTTDQGGTPRTITTKHDENGNLRRIIYPDGVTFLPVSDGLDRLTGVVDDYDVSSVAIAYDAQGRRARLQRGGVTTTYGYDAISRPTGISDDLPGTAADVATGYGYNPAGQIVVKTRSNTDYAFAGYYTVNRPYATNGLNQYVSAGPAGFTYDANGNLTSDGTTGYGYDIENRLVSSTAGVVLEYDPLGRLYRVAGPTSDTRFVYDGDQLSLEYNAAGTILKRYLHGPGEDDPLLWYEGPGLNDLRTLQSDVQGSVVSVANAGGLLLGINAYDEYGIPGANGIGRFRYTGQAWIPELGLYHYKARFYSPTLGRFLQTDPIGYADQNNLYAYVGNDPINGRDPTGLSDLNTLPRSFPRYQEADEIDAPGFYTIVGHGGTNGVVDQRPGSYRALNPEQLYDAAMKGSYKVGDPILLLNCLLGANWNNKVSFAQRLSNTSGAIVIANTGETVFDRNPSDNITTLTAVGGEFRVFRPGDKNSNYLGNKISFNRKTGKATISVEARTGSRIKESSSICVTEKCQK